MCKDLHNSYGTIHLRFARLLCEALPTDNLSDSETINGMMCVLGASRHTGKRRRQRGCALVQSKSCGLYFRRQDGTIIMTNTTTKGCPAARSNHGALSNVVRTRRPGLFHSLRSIITNGLDNCACLVSVAHVRIRKVVRVASDAASATVCTPGVGKRRPSPVHQMLNRPPLL